MSRYSHSTPFFSVVVPVYNAQDYLRDCLHAIEGQAFDDCEVIVVDDGSTDASLGIEREFERRASVPVRVIARENRGPYEARAAGIDAASGAFVLFCDADDAFLPGSFERLREELDKDPCDVLAFEATTERGAARPLFGYPAGGSVYEDGAKAGLIEEAATGFSHNNLWNKCVRRELLAGLDPVHPARFGEDLYVVLQVFDRAERIRFIGDCLYWYCETEGSITRGTGLFDLDDIELLQAKTDEVLERWGLAEKTVPAMAKKDCWFCAKAVQAIMGARLTSAQRRLRLDGLRARRFVQKGVEGSGFKALRPDLGMLVALLAQRRYHLLRAAYLACGPLRGLRRLAGKARGKGRS